MGDKLIQFFSGGNKKRRATDHAIESNGTGANGTHYEVRNKSKSFDVCGIKEENMNMWNDVDLIKTMAPVIMCILPTPAKEFVASVLLAIGAYPLIPEDVEDVESQLGAAQGLLVDTSAKRDIVEEVIEHYPSSSPPLILVCWESGTNDARKNLTRKVAEICKPTVISGRLGDVQALSQDLMDRAEGIIDAQDGREPVQSLRSKSKSPEEKLMPGGASAPHGGSSPRFMRKKEAEKIFQRQETAIPQMVLKGQFRHRSIKNASISDGLLSAQKLAAQLACYVHLYETNVITCGEFFYEINNTQLGMEKLHHTVQCAAAIIATTVACVKEENDGEVTLHTCGHALSLYHVAAEDAAEKVSIGKDLINPGSLKVAFIDRLHELDEITVQLKSQSVFHNAPPIHK